MPNNITVDFSDEQQVSNYVKALTSRNGIQWEYRKEAVEHCEELSVHFNGEKPTKILNDTRPNEPSDIKKYRADVFQPITKSKAKKIVNILQRINNSKNYSIQYPSEISSLLNEDDLEDYCTEYYPYYNNIVQWVFDVLLKKMLVDPNAVICFRPIETANDVEYLKPYGFIYGSKNVIDFKIDNYYTILLDEKSMLNSNGVNSMSGKIYNIYTTSEIIEVRQVGTITENRYETTVLFKHDIGILPVVTLGGEYVDGTFPFLYESYVSGVLPFWNKALRLDSDIDANYIQHLYLERVEIQVECDNNLCGQNGAKIGEVCGTNNRMSQCSRCNGTGYITGRSPYGVTSVKKDALSGENIEFPGVTYVSKPTEIVEIAERKLKSFIDDGFSAINMDILANAGENQSGVAKTIDRTDLDSFLGMVSNNIFDNIIYNSINIINLMRYKSVLGESVYENMPVINKPTHFDVLSSQQIISEITPNLPNQLKDVLLIDVINKRFPNDYFQREYNVALIELDPLRGKTEDEKMIGTTNGWISKQDATLSANISKYILDAHHKYEDFFEKTREEKLALLYKMIPTVSKNNVTLFDSSNPTATQQQPNSN